MTNVRKKKGLAALVILCSALAGASALAKPDLSALKAQAEKIQRATDTQIMWYFRYQVESAWYRGRLKLLQKEWQGLLGGLIKPKVRKYPPPPAVGFRIDEAVASTETSLAAAALTPNCKRKSSCRVWVRIAFSKGLAKKGGKFEVSADLKQARGTRRYAVPAKLMTITGTAMSVDVPLGQLPLTRGKYVGRVKVLCGGRYASKALTLDLARSW